MKLVFAATDITDSFEQWISNGEIHDNFSKQSISSKLQMKSVDFYPQFFLDKDYVRFIDVTFIKYGTKLIGDKFIINNFYDVEDDFIYHLYFLDGVHLVKSTMVEDKMVDFIPKENTWVYDDDEPQTKKYQDTCRLFRAHKELWNMSDHEQDLVISNIQKPIFKKILDWIVK